MLHAFARNKSKAYTRFLRMRNSSEPRVSSEDEITSLVFGALEFLSASDHWHLWKTVLHSHASAALSGSLPSNFTSDFDPSSCTMEFWPRKDSIEPDLVITFCDRNDAIRTLLVELKWDSPLSGSNQLHKQWSLYQLGAHEVSLHLFIAKSMGEFPSDLQTWTHVEADGKAAVRLRGLRWHEFRHEVAKLTQLRETPAPLNRWCYLVGSFLQQVGIRPFLGFHSSIQLADSIPDGDIQALHFWDGETARSFK